MSRKNILRYGITSVIGAAMVITTLNTHGFWELTELVDRFRVLTDAFTIPGLSILCAGVLVWVSNKGVFDPISYATRYLLGHFIPGLHGKGETYYDYVTRKSKEGKINGFGFLLIVGGVFFAIALVFYALYYTQL